MLHQSPRVKFMKHRLKFKSVFNENHTDLVLVQLTDSMIRSQWLTGHQRGRLSVNTVFLHKCCMTSKGLEYSVGYVNNKDHVRGTFIMILHPKKNYPISLHFCDTLLYIQTSEIITLKRLYLEKSNSCHGHGCYCGSNVMCWVMCVR